MNITIGNSSISINESYLQSCTEAQKQRDRANLMEAAREIVEEIMERGEAV